MSEPTKFVFPPLLSSKQVAEALGIQRTSMALKRKTKGFPQPTVIIDGFPVWLESDIIAWMEAKADAEK
jgi:predicted DNA-binding transcriptional regulator AlpA